MQQRNLVYGLILGILCVGIAVVVVLILRKQAMGPDVVLLPSAPTQQGQPSPKATETGEKTKSRDSYKVAPPWTNNGSGTVEPIYQPDPVNAPQTGLDQT